MTRGALHARTTAALAVALACGALAVAGCGDSSSDSQPQASTTSPATTAPPPAPPPAPAAPPAPLRPGDVAAGQAVFAESCDTCHAGLGSRAYIGPRLAGQGLTASLIRTRVVQGKAPMPAGLASGQDLADVVAYVLSLQ